VPSIPTNRYGTLHSEHGGNGSVSNSGSCAIWNTNETGRYCFQNRTRGQTRVLSMAARLYSVSMAIIYPFWMLYSRISYVIFNYLVAELPALIRAASCAVANSNHGHDDFGRQPNHRVASAGASYAKLVTNLGALPRAQPHS
jgi:hypothetical protein